LAGTSRAAIRGAVQHLLDDSETYGRMARATNPYGDGQAAERIADHIVTCVAQGTRKSGLAVHP
jgi:UDP-N-acetylglucosamine 2-epimerase (non-hydrolysing)